MACKKSIIKNNYIVNYETNDLINNYYRNSDIKSYSILENKKSFDNSPYTLPDAIVVSSLNSKNNLTNSYYFNLFNKIGFPQSCASTEFSMVGKHLTKV